MPCPERERRVVIAFTGSLKMIRGRHALRARELLFACAAVFILSECGADRTFHEREAGGSAGTAAGKSGMSGQGAAGGPSRAGAGKGATGELGGGGDTPDLGGAGETGAGATGDKGGSANSGAGGSKAGGEGTASGGESGSSESGAAGEAGAAGSDGSVSSGPHPIQIAIATTVLCTLISDGRIYCWGGGLLGDGSDGSTPSKTPVQVSGISTAAKLTGGGGTLCAVLSDGSLKCWGDDEYGAVSADGIGSQGGIRTPMAVRGLTGISEAFTNSALTCVLLTNHTVRCWGISGASGSMLAGKTTMPGITTAVHLGGDTAGGDACAVLTDGTVKCWAATTDTPATIAGLPNDIVQVAGKCALSSDGTVRCWGPGGKGQIGNGNTDDQASPQKVEQLGVATGIASGADHVCAALADGSVSCWGKDGFFDSVDYGAYPIAVDVGPVAFIAANTQSSCLIEKDNTVKCWGSNITGALLGPNGDDDSATPVVIPNLPGEP